jgi:acetyltransferase-like isoleucine patch superfamily enzyme
MNALRNTRALLSFLRKTPKIAYDYIARKLIIEDLLSRGLAFSPLSIVHGSGNITCAGDSSFGAFGVIWCGIDESGPLKKGQLQIGKNVYIGDHCCIRASGCPISIGDHTLIANGVTIVSSNHGLKQGQPITSQAWESPGPEVRIGSDVWIGANATVLPGTTIADGSVIAAGAVVRGFVPPNEIWGGVPAKKLGNRPT